MIASIGLVCASCAQASVSSEEPTADASREVRPSPDAGGGDVSTDVLDAAADGADAGIDSTTESDLTDSDLADLSDSIDTESDPDSIGEDIDDGGADIAEDEIQAEVSEDVTSDDSDADQNEQPIQNPAAHCNPAGWCWQHPIPAGVNFNDIHAVAADDVWAVGEHGVIIHFDGEGWTAADSPVETHLQGVQGAASDNIWAVGDGGVTLHYAGSEWEVVTSGVETDLYAVWTVDGHQAWAVGASGEILRWKSGVWEPETPITLNHLFAVTGTAEDDVFACGTTGEILHFAGTEWEEIYVSSTSAHNILDCAAVSRGEVWAGMLDGTIRRQWVDTGTTITVPSARAVYSVAAVSADEIYAMGVSKLFKWDGENWSEIGPAGESRFAFMHGLSVIDDAIWLAGWYGNVFRKPTVGAWEMFPDRSTKVLYAMEAVSETEVWGIGTMGNLVRFGGAEWSNVSNSAPSGAQDLWVAAENDIWAAGYGGVISRWNGVSWTPQNAPEATNFHAIWGESASSVWALGKRGGANEHWHWDGESWTAELFGQDSSPSVNGIWGNGSEVFAVGADVIIRSEGEWAVETVPVDDDWYGVYGADDTIWVVGESILERDSDGWSAPEQPEIPMILEAVYGVGERAWAVGDTTNNKPVLLTFEEGAWTQVDGVTSWSLSDIAGYGSSVWVSDTSGGVITLSLD